MLGKYVRVRVTSPMHSFNKRFGYEYKLNFGSIGNFVDNSRVRKGLQFAYIMGISHPVRNFDGRVIAVVRRHGGRGVVWVVAPKSTRYIINDIRESISFAENIEHCDIECLYERSCGAVVLRKDARNQVLLIKNKRSAHWGFPKGHIEKGETQEETAIREIKEETGLDIEIQPGFSCKSEYTIQGKVEKAVIIYLAKALSDEVIIQEEEIDDYIWVDFESALKMLRFENDKSILTKAIAFLNSPVSQAEE